jgi:outer membrane lipoprotein LolB
MLSALPRWLVASAALLLAGCATLEQQPQATVAPEFYQQHLASLSAIQGFSIDGRIGVQTDGKGFSGSMHWQHSVQGDHIALFSPLGSQVASISTTPEGVTLTASDGKAYHAQDAASLTQQNLGWSLPMKGLPDWVLGRPTNGMAELTQWDETGNLVRLKQDGWDIEYAQYSAVNGYQLPGKVTLRSLKVNLKLIIEQWRMTDESLVLHEVK